MALPIKTFKKRPLKGSLADCCKLCHSSGPLHPCSHVIPQWMNETQLQSKWTPRIQETEASAISATTINPPSLQVAERLNAEVKQNNIQSRNRQNEQRMRIVSSHPGEHQQRSPTGIYGTFVCKKCEELFASWDGYAAKILTQQPTATAQGWNFGPYDHEGLKFFFLSILWRAHACEHPFFEPVDLNSHAKSLGDCLLRENKKMLREYEVIPTWSSHLLSLGVMTPIRVQIESIAYWQLYLPRFQALIKPDPGSGATCMQPFAMSESNNLYMLEKTFTEFNEIHTAKQVTKENLKKKHAKHKKS